MQKTLVNLFYWLLMKAAENYYGEYYGESIKTEGVPQTPYF